MKWQPIETAPTDGGAKVLVFDTWDYEVSGTEETPEIGTAVRVGGCWYSEHADFYSVRCDATHWMPLPEPPDAA